MQFEELARVVLVCAAGTRRSIVQVIQHAWVGGACAQHVAEIAERVRADDLALPVWQESADVLLVAVKREVVAPERDPLFVPRGGRTHRLQQDGRLNLLARSAARRPRYLLALAGIGKQGGQIRIDQRERRLRVDARERASVTEGSCLVAQGQNRLGNGGIELHALNASGIRGPCQPGRMIPEIN